MTDAERHHAAAHAVQSGVAMEMNYDPQPTTPKHLRTGINMAFSDQAGLARLLIAKGLISEEEYVKAVADEAEAEQLRYEKRLSARLGREIKLG